MLATKGYGLSVEDIDWSCPADMEPYLKSYQMSRNEKDVMQWQLGQYIATAIACNFSKQKYPKQPAFQEDNNESVIPCGESQEKIAIFEMKQRINLLRENGLPESPI